MFTVPIRARGPGTTSSLTDATRRVAVSDSQFRKTLALGYPLSRNRREMVSLAAWTAS